MENYERHVIEGVMDKIAPNSEMSQNERYFLNGILRHVKPHKILEVGVAAGGSSAIILNATQDISDSVLYSADYLDFYYRAPHRKVGFTVPENFPEYLDRWKLFAGGDVSRYIEQIGDGIDFALIDTAHVHPVETLNFLCVLPFMKIGSWVVLHDISLQWSSEYSLACKYLFDHVVSENKLMPTPDSIPLFANIGAFQITNDTHKNIKDVFMSLTIPWGIWSDNWKTHGDFPDFEDVSKIIKKYYCEEFYEIFEKSIDFQISMRENWNRPSLPISLKLKQCLKIMSPSTFFFLKKIWRNIRNKKIM